MHAGTAGKGELFHASQESGQALLFFPYLLQSEARFLPKHF